MKRRDFIGGLAGAAAAWPLIARAQSSVPVIGFLSSRSLEDSKALMTEFHKGLNESGYAEGKNVSIEYRWAEGDYGRLPALAADLVARRVRIIATTGGGLTAVAAKEVTADIPIIFASGGDPIQLGLVASLSRPAGNVTGVSLFISELGTKRLDFLRQLVPAVRTVGILANPDNPASGLEARDIQAHASGGEMNARIFTASSGAFEQLFAAMVSENVQALVV